MATTNTIIDHCLKAINEDTTSPVEMTRVEVLALINQLYQNDIGKRLYNLATYSYDASDADHTITAGVGTLPTDFLGMAQVYDGVPVTNSPLTQIFYINQKVADTANTTQYMLPNPTTLWIFGTTPTNNIKLYYYQKPTALTDSSGSSPTALKSEFHIDPFVAYIKYVYAMRQNNTYDALDMVAMIEDWLNRIEYAHKPERQDNSINTIVDMYGGL